MRGQKLAIDATEQSECFVYLRVFPIAEHHFNRTPKGSSVAANLKREILRRDGWAICVQEIQHDVPGVRHGRRTLLRRQQQVPAYVKHGLNQPRRTADGIVIVWFPDLILLTHLGGPACDAGFALKALSLFG